MSDNTDLPVTLQERSGSKYRYYRCDLCQRVLPPVQDGAELRRAYTAHSCCLVDHPDALEVHVATKKPLCVVVDCPIHGQGVHTLYKEEKGK